MKIFINGKEETLLNETCLYDLIIQRGLNSDSIIVEYNFELIGTQDWTSIKLKENDKLEILQFVGGG